MNRDRIATYAQVMILALAASVIYSAPYLRQLFKTSLLEAFSLTEAQLGNLSSTYALSCLVCYVPGGWLADNLLGYQKAVLYGALIIMLGHFTLAIPLE